MKGPDCVRLLAAAALLTCSPGLAAADDTVSAVADEPRAFGYMVGDLVRREIVVTKPSTLDLDPDSLPSVGRRGRALELHRVEWRREDRGASDRYRLLLEYQVFLSPPAVRTLEMPPVTLHFVGAPREQDVRIDAWPVTVSPLVPVDVSPRHGLGDLRPDAAAPLIDTWPAQLRLSVAAGLAALLAAYLVSVYVGVPWWSSRHRPFSHAWRELRRLSPSGTAQQRRDAYRAVHRALDRTAGEALFEHGIERFVAARPDYRPLRGDLTEFFARSREEFFADKAAAGESVEWLLAFARRCRDVERGAA